MPIIGSGSFDSSDSVQNPGRKSLSFLQSGKPNKSQEGIPLLEGQAKVNPLVHSGFPVKPQNGVAGFDESVPKFPDDELLIESIIRFPDELPNDEVFCILLPEEELIEIQLSLPKQENGLVGQQPATQQLPPRIANVHVGPPPPPVVEVLLVELVDVELIPELEEDELLLEVPSLNPLEDEDSLLPEEELEEDASSPPEEELEEDASSPPEEELEEDEELPEEVLEEVVVVQELFGNKPTSFK